MSAKTISQFSVVPETAEGYKRTGRVAVYATPDWLKGGPLLKASLSVSEARRLALKLLQFAELVEERSTR